MTSPLQMLTSSCIQLYKPVNFPARNPASQYLAGLNPASKQLAGLSSMRDSIMDIMTSLITAAPNSEVPDYFLASTLCTVQ